MITFLEIHRRSVIHAEVTNNRFKSCKSLYNFRYNSYNNNLPFRRALNKMSNIMRDKIKKVEYYDLPQNDARIPSLGRDVEIVNCITKETCLSPKQGHLNRLANDASLNHTIRERHKFRKGKPVFRVSDVNKTIN